MESYRTLRIYHNPPAGHLLKDRLLVAKILYMVTFNQLHNGYRRGELTGNKVDYRFEIRLSSGALIYLYDDEFVKD